MTTRIIHADNLDGVSTLAAEGVRAHLIYLDPPFFTQRDFYFEPRDGGPAEVAFSDKWPSLEAYVEALRLRVVAGRELLTTDGCMVVHVDPTASHYVKVMMDGVFGRECFASEIVWRYRKWSSAHCNFAGVHDVLLRYVRDPSVKPRWNQLYEARSASTLETWGTKRVVSTTIDGKRVTKTAEDESLGVAMGDVWELGIIAPIALERTGYPTQKPETLLERLILACSHVGDTVLDLYAGSGTTVDVADRLGRHGIGIDCSPVAVRVAQARLAKPAQHALMDL